MSVRPNQPNLMGLPAELRLKIYDYYLLQDDIVSLVDFASPEPAKTLRLVSKTIANEAINARETYLKVNTFASTDRAAKRLSPPSLASSHGTCGTSSNTSC